MVVVPEAVAPCAQATGLALDAKTTSLPRMIPAVDAVNQSPWRGQWVVVVVGEKAHMVEEATAQAVLEAAEVLGAAAKCARVIGSAHSAVTCSLLRTHLADVAALLPQATARLLAVAEAELEAVAAKEEERL